MLQSCLVYYLDGIPFFSSSEWQAVRGLCLLGAGEKTIKKGSAGVRLEARGAMLAASSRGAVRDTGARCGGVGPGSRPAARGRANCTAGLRLNRATRAALGVSWRPGRSCGAEGGRNGRPGTCVHLSSITDVGAVAGDLRPARLPAQCRDRPGRGAQAMRCPGSPRPQRRPRGEAGRRPGRPDRPSESGQPARRDAEGQ